MHYDFPNPKDARFPKMVVVSITNVCDFACKHCYHKHYVKRAKHSQKFLDKKIFYQIADEIGLYPNSSLRFIAWGEPLLHPNIVEFINYARKVAPRNPLTLITNGYWLTPECSRSLMEAGLDLIEVSIDAATSETYRKSRISPYIDSFSRIEHNVKEMIQQREILDLHTRITVSYISYPSEESMIEYALFERKWTDVVDEIIKRPVHSFKGVVKDLGKPLTKRCPCYGLWARFNINPWGQASVCYNDWENKYIIGDLTEGRTTISALWQGHILSRLRDEQCRGEFKGMCATCRDYNSYAWDNPYEKVVSRSCYVV